MSEIDITALITDFKEKMDKLEFPNNFVFDTEIELNEEQRKQIYNKLFPTEKERKEYVFLYDNSKLTIGINWCDSCDSCDEDLEFDENNIPEGVIAGKEFEKLIANLKENKKK